MSSAPAKNKEKMEKIEKTEKNRKKIKQVLPKYKIICPSNRPYIHSHHSHNHKWILFFSFICLTISYLVQCPLTFCCTTLFVDSLRTSYNINNSYVNGGICRCMHGMGCMEYGGTVYFKRIIVVGQLYHWPELPTWLINSNYENTSSYKNISSIN